MQRLRPRHRLRSAPQYVRRRTGARRFRTGRSRHWPPPRAPTGSAPAETHYRQNIEPRACALDPHALTQKLVGAAIGIEPPAAAVVALNFIILGAVLTVMITFVSGTVLVVTRQMGQTETFFWKRFGGALLLSIVGDASNVASNRLSNVDETRQAPSGAAAVALESDIRIQPVLRARQGAEMTIFAARDFDFSNVYSLRLRR